MEYMVREYLVHSGYQETFMALEDEISSSSTNTYKNKENKNDENMDDIKMEMDDQVKK